MPAALLRGVPSPPDDSSPPLIPDYALLRRIGAGSYGDVWIARTATGVYRAVKVVWRDRFADAGPYEREFRGLREFERVSLVQPRQLALLHVARRDEDGFFYYVMELADDVDRGRDIDPATYRPLTLREGRRAGAMTVARTLELGVELARGLAVLHEHGLVHRDIKPSNVVIIGGVPKLADIGLVASTTLALTFVGTEGFVAPEGPGAPAADVYALGKVLYELVTGLDRTLFPQLPEDFAARADRLAFLELNAVVLRACEPNLARRPAHARELLEDLLLVQAGKSVRRLWAAERGLARALKVAAVLAAMAGIAGTGAWVAWRRAQAEIALRAAAEADRDALARRTQYAGLLAQAARAVERGELGSGRRLLTLGREVVHGAVGLEWNLLTAQSWGDADRVLSAGGLAVSRLAWLQPGETVAVARGNDRVDALQVSDGGMVWSVPGMTALGGVSPDGRWLLGIDRTARPWAVPLRGGRPALAAAVGPDPTARPAASWPLGVDATGCLWGVEGAGAGRLWCFDPDRPAAMRTEDWLGQFAGGGWQYFRGAATPAGADAAGDPALAVGWVRQRGPEVAFLVTVRRPAGSTQAWHPTVRPGSLGWRRLASGGWSLEIVDDLTGRRSQVALGADELTEQLMPSGEPGAGAWTAAAMATDGEFKLKGSELRTATAGSGPGDEAVKVWRGHGAPIAAVVAAGDGLVSGDVGGEILWWRRPGPGASAARDAVRVDPDIAAMRLTFSSDGTQVYLPDPDGVRVVDPATGREVARWPAARWMSGASGGRAWGVTLAGDAVIALDERDGAVAWRGPVAAAKVMTLAGDYASGRLLIGRTDGTWERRAANGTITVVANVGDDWGFGVANKGRIVWSATRGGGMVGRDLEAGGAMVHRVDTAPVVAHLAALPQHGLVIGAVTTGELVVVAAATGAAVARVPLGAGGEYAVVTPDEARVIVGGADGALHVIDPTDWRLVATLSTGLNEPIEALAIGPQGASIAGLTKSGRFFWLRSD